MLRRALAFLLFVTVLWGGPAFALCVSAPEANLRYGPGTNYRKTWEVFRYMPLKKLKKQGDWYRVQDVDGDIHWVYGPLVTEKYQCAVVKDDKANVRSGPGTNYKQRAYSPVFKYYMFKILEIRGDWVKVQDDYGDTGWIYRPLLWIQ
jgi:SH3-like domain-containing protein